MTSAAAVTEQERDWQAFQQLTTTVDHWRRPGWVDGRQAYYWFLTFEGAAELRGLAARCQGQLRLPALDLVPLDGLHLTLQRVAFADEVLPGSIDQVATEARRLCADVAPLPLEIGPLAGSAGALRFTAAPSAPISLLRRRLQDAAAAVPTLVPVPEHPRGFRPHVGIGYFNSAVPVEDLVPIVAPLRDLPTVTATVAAVRLVLLHRRDGVYRWQDLDAIALAGTDGR